MLSADIRICYRLSRPVIYQVLLEILRSQSPSAQATLTADIRYRLFKYKYSIRVS